VRARSRRVSNVIRASPWWIYIWPDRILRQRFTARFWRPDYASACVQRSERRLLDKGNVSCSGDLILIPSSHQTCWRVIKVRELMAGAANEICLAITRGASPC